MPRHSDAFLTARRPRVIVRSPEPVWVIDNYRVHTWYYRNAPEVGTKVLYLEDGSTTRITRVNSTRIWLANSCSMRRPYSGARLAAWVLPRLQNLIPSMTTLTEKSRTTKRGMRLRPDAVTLSV